MVVGSCSDDDKGPDQYANIAPRSITTVSILGLPVEMNDLSAADDGASVVVSITI